MKRIFQQICELYSYIYYRIYTWLAKYFGKYYTADQIGFLLPMILLTMSLAPIYNLCSFMISVDFKDSIFVFCIIHAFFIVRMSNAFTRSLPQMDKKYRKESKVQRKKRLKKSDFVSGGYCILVYNLYVYSCYGSFISIRFNFSFA